MKKVFSLLLALVLLLGLTPVLAADFEGNITWQNQPIVVYVDKPLTVVADVLVNKDVTRFQWFLGSATEGSVEFTIKEGIPTTLEFPFDTSVAGTYSLTLVVWHHNKMSDRKIESTVTVEVKENVFVPVRYEIREWVQGEGVLNGGGKNINAYKAVGQLWGIDEEGGERLVLESYDFLLTPNKNLNLKGEFKLYNNLPVTLVK